MGGNDFSLTETVTGTSVAADTGNEITGIYIKIIGVSLFFRFLRETRLQGKNELTPIFPFTLVRASPSGGQRLEARYGGRVRIKDFARPQIGWRQVGRRRRGLGSAWPRPWRSGGWWASG